MTRKTVKQPTLPESWEQEARAVRAVQIAFDLDEDIQKAIRREALEMDMNPSDRIRQLLGLPTRERPRRLRLSISLSEEEIRQLAEQYDLDINDRVSIKHKAAELLALHIKETS